MGLRRGLSQSRNVIRAISLLVIVATIPFYIIGLGSWAISQGRPSTGGPIFTPLGGVGDNADSGNGGFATFTPMGGDGVTDDDPANTPFFPTATTNFGGTVTFFTPGVFVSPTPPPTFYIPPTAAPTLVPTNTQPVPPTPITAPTDMIAPTQPPLAPPTDTPTV